jgi:alanine-glyoxylate transaminase/serine-glyoxylate transaminase/serine-pyruvate transaminase
MGISVVDPQRGDVDKIISSVREAIAEAIASKESVASST